MPSTTITEPLLGVPAVAKLFRVQDCTVRGWIANGDLIAFNTGGKGKRPSWRIDPRDVEAFRIARSTNVNGKATKAKRKKFAKPGRKHV